MFTAEVFTVAKIWKQPKYPSGSEWIKKLCCVDTMECYSTLKRKEIIPFAAAWMDLENIMLSEISLSEIDKCRMISLICGI